MDTAQWPQEIVVVKPIELEDHRATNTCPKPAAAAANAILEKKQPRPPQKDQQQPLNCPRCNSINTKFCYYNNYSLTQPRYFCKTCRRYWTAGGSLRNIPVGGGSRKNNKIRSSSSFSSKSSPQNCTAQNPKFHEGQDLNLTSAAASSSSTSTTTITTSTAINTSTASSTSQFSALELLSRGMQQHSFMPVQVLQAGGGDHNNNTVYNCGFPLQDFKPTLNFSLDHGIGGISGFAGLHGVDQETGTTNGRVLFPFEDLKQVSNNNLTMDQNSKEDHQGYSTGYWTGMLGGGGSW